MAWAAWTPVVPMQFGAAVQRPPTESNTVEANTPSNSAGSSDVSVSEMLNPTESPMNAKSCGVIMSRVMTRIEIPCDGNP